MAKISLPESLVCKMRLSCKVQVATINIGTVGQKRYMAHVNYSARCGTLFDHTYPKLLIC